MTQLVYDMTLRPDLVASHQRFWDRLGRPGTWFEGADRLAIASEVRAASACQLCHDRLSAVSPNAVGGSHDSVTDLDDRAVEVIHRLTTDPGRLTRDWFDSLVGEHLSVGEYVEIVGTVVAVISIDVFCIAVGQPIHPLPDAMAGAPTRYTPSSAQPDAAWVPMIPASKARGSESDLWEKGRVGNVIRAMSVVPDEVRTLQDLSATHYIPRDQMMDLRSVPFERLTRMQIETIAARVSARNECFY